MAIDDLGNLIFLVFVFLIAGMVKGVVGMGLPTISLCLLALSLNLPVAMGLMLLPSLVTNVWQALAGGETRAVMVKIWPFLLGAAMAVWIGAEGLSRIGDHWLLVLLAVLIITYASLGLFGGIRHFDWRLSSMSGFFFGVVNGLFTGLTGAFIFPGLVYLQSLALSRDQLVQAMGMLFTVSTIALLFALGSRGFLSYSLLAMSGAAIIPALIGMVIGQSFRKYINEQQFRRLFFFTLMMIGFYLAGTAIL